MIPKIIHYCWFGGEKPEFVKNYISGWQKMCPDYEIKEWNENNFDIQEYTFSRDAYKEKKWAFVSDFVRFSVLEEYGGVYLDTDVELIKGLSSLEEECAFVGFEVSGVGSAIIGCDKNNKIIQAIAARYKKTSFYLDDGKLNLLTSPDYINEELEKYGFKRINQLQRINDMTVYPSNYFYPYNSDTLKYQTTKETIGIHHFDGSWLDVKTKYQLEKQKALNWITIKRLRIWVAVCLAEYKFGGIKGLCVAVRNRIANKNE